MEEKFDWGRLASILFCSLAIGFLVFLVGKYALAIVMPFIIAWGMALLIRPMAELVSRKMKIPTKLCAAVMLVVLFLLLGFLIAVSVDRLLTEGGRLLESIGSEDTVRLVSEFVRGTESVSARIPFLKPLRDNGELAEMFESIDEMAVSMLREFATRLTSFLTTALGKIIRSFPSVFVFAAVTVIATFYFTIDIDAVHGAVERYLPKKASARLPEFKETAKKFAAKYVKAYLILLFFTFCELFIGLTLLSVEYAFLLALLISLIDILPVLGCGAVLVPWSVAAFLMRDFKRGIGLLVLWLVITLIHQFAEPRVVGGSLGIHPILTLVSMYVGYRVFGLVGIIVAPIAAMLIRFFASEVEKRSRTA